MTFLLDVNVLIALVDPLHIQSAAAHAWFEREGSSSFATCPLTENGLLRIVGSSRYSNSPGSPAAVFHALASLTGLAGHEFWPDEISLTNPKYVKREHILSSSQVTDVYLLALAVARGGRLATFDRKIMAGAVSGGPGALHVIA